MSHTPTHRSGAGFAAKGRHEIRALENVGKTTGGIQYRTTTGAQAELILPSATDFTLGHDGIKPTWVSATQVATATQPVFSYLYTVTASATQAFLSWASVATQYKSFYVDMYNIQFASLTSLAMRISTDGINLDTASNKYFWNVFFSMTLGGFAATYDTSGNTASNSASQGQITPTGQLVSQSLSSLNGSITIWPDSLNSTVEPSLNWNIMFMATTGNITRSMNTMGNNIYWGMQDIKGISLFPAFGAASFSNGLIAVYGKA